MDNVDIPVENVQLMEGTAPMDKIEKYIQEYDDKLAKYGVDLYLPSVSRGGYVGFLEPGRCIIVRKVINEFSETNKATRTRFISLGTLKYSYSTDIVRSCHSSRRCQ